MIHLTYNPEIFDVTNIQNAMNIILTPQGGLSTEDRWKTEGEYLLTLMEPLHLNEQSRVLDYGCGIGRMAKLLIEKYNCWVIGVDISESMRDLAIKYVNSSHFVVCSPHGLDDDNLLKCDATLAVWVLQHCRKPAEDVARIKQALKDGGKLFVLNNSDRRDVPTKEKSWADDKVDIRAMLNKEFILEKINILDTSVMAKDVITRIYSGIYSKNGPKSL